MTDHGAARVSPGADTVSDQADKIRTALDVGRSADYVKQPPEELWLDAAAAVVSLSRAAEFGVRRLERIARRIPPLPEMVSDPDTMKYVAALRTIQRLAQAAPPATTAPEPVEHDAERERVDALDAFLADVDGALDDEPGSHDAAVRTGAIFARHQKALRGNPACTYCGILRDRWCDLTCFDGYTHATGTAG